MSHTVFLSGYHYNIIIIIISSRCKPLTFNYHLTMRINHLVIWCKPLTFNYHLAMRINHLVIWSRLFQSSGTMLNVRPVVLYLVSCDVPCLVKHPLMKQQNDSLVKAKNSSQKILSVICQPTVCWLTDGSSKGMS